MSEKNEVWGAMRDHVTPYGHFTRIESSTEAGIPDLAYTVNGRSGWIENKVFKREGLAPKHLTLEQIRWGEAEVRAGGTWHLLVRAPKSVWLLYDIAAAAALIRGESPSPRLRHVGPFPTIELLREIRR